MINEKYHVNWRSKICGFSARVYCPKSEMRGDGLNQELNQPLHATAARGPVCLSVNAVSCYKTIIIHEKATMLVSEPVDADRLLMTGFETA